MISDGFWESYQILHATEFASFHADLIKTKSVVNILFTLPKKEYSRFTPGKDGDMAIIAIGDSVLEFLFRRLFLLRNVKLMNYDYVNSNCRV